MGRPLGNHRSTMKKVKYTLAILVVGVVLVSCSSDSSSDIESTEEVVIKSSTEYKVVEIEEQYSMKIPKFMTVTNQFGEDKSLQCSNSFKEKYVSVLNKSEDQAFAFIEDYGSYGNSKLESYAKARLKSFMESGISVISRTDLKSEMVGGNKVCSIVIDATSSGLSRDITYYFTYVQGKKKYYEISAWTLLSRKGAYVDEVREMVKSFKEL